jgi:glycosyltransferase involved in cell wall biosynthesis
MSQQTEPASLPPVGSKRVAVVVGRFNPPTKGHYEVISAVKKFIRQHPELRLETGPAVVVIGGSKADTDKKRNPLTVEERTVFMKASGRADGALFFSAPDAFKAFSTLREKGYEPVVVAAGSDRLKAYKDILDKYFKGPDDKPITHHTLALARDADAVETKKGEKSAAVDSTLESGKDSGKFSTSEISGSLARRAVELGYEEEFAKIVGLENKPDLAKKMFGKIKASLGSGE